jgi:hypothetical protein
MDEAEYKFKGRRDEYNSWEQKGIISPTSLLTLSLCTHILSIVSVLLCVILSVPCFVLEVKWMKVKTDRAVAVAVATAPLLHVCHWFADCTILELSSILRKQWISWWVFKFSRRRVWRWLSTEMLHLHHQGVITLMMEQAPLKRR